MADEGGADEEDEAAWAGAAEVAIDLLRNGLLGVSGGGASPASPPGTAPPILALSHALWAPLPPPRATALSSQYLQSSISPGTLLDLLCSSGHTKSCIHQFFVA